MKEIKCISNRLFFLLSMIIISTFVFSSNNLSCAENTTIETKNSIIFKIYSFMPQHKVMEKYTPFCDYLSTLLNKEVKISIFSETDEFLKAIGNGKFDLAFIDSINFTKLINTYGKQKIIAIMSSNDNPYFFEHIVVAKNSLSKQIRNLNNKNIKFAFSMDQSKSIIQEAMLVEGGVNEQYLKNRNYYTPKFAYEEMASALASEESSAGCMDEFLLRKYNNSLRSIAKSGPIPAPMIIANDSLPNEIIKKLQEAITSLHDQVNGKTIISNLTNNYNMFSLPENIKFDYLQHILKKDTSKIQTSKMGQGIMPWEKGNGCPPFYLRTDDGQIINPKSESNSDKPYSIRQTCGSCHDYNKISQGYHFQMGMNEREGFDNKKYPWKITPGMTGGW